MACEAILFGVVTGSSAFKFAFRFVACVSTYYMLCCDMLRNVLDLCDSMSPTPEDQAVFCLVGLWADSLAVLSRFMLGFAVRGHFLVL